MSLGINVGGVWKSATPKINVAGTWKTPQSIWANVAGVWKQVWSAVAAAVSLSTYGQTNSGTTAALTFSAVTCTVTGNTGSPTYSWTIQDLAGIGTWSILSGQGTATCTARVTSVPGSNTAQAALRCTVTVDGSTLTTPDCTLTYTNTNTA